MRREGSTDLGLLMMLEDADGMSRAGDHIVCADDDWLVISRTGRRGQRRNESSRQHLVDQPWVRSTGGSTTGPNSPSFFATKASVCRRMPARRRWWGGGFDGQFAELSAV